MKRFSLPDLGEGLTESELVSWRVAVGDHVELNQVIAEVETAKALVELPAPTAGVVTRLHVEPGTTVLVGEALVDFAPDGETAPSPSVPEADRAEVDRPSGAADREPVLVGYGPRTASGERPRRRARSGDDDTPAPAHTVPAHTAPVPERSRPRATPPVRRLARDLGVDLGTLVGTGVCGRIAREEVERAATGPSGRLPERARGAGAAPAGTPATPATAATAADGSVRRPITGVRRRTAEAMVSSAFTAPHVTEFLTVDVTPTMSLLDALARSPRTGDHRVNILTVLAKAVCIAVRRTPAVNASWDEAAGEIVEYGHVGLGIAAATPRGLLVPNIARAEELSLFELADAVADLVRTAREGRTAPAELRGGTITISNVGVFGVDAGTPILNPGEAAIIALGAVRRRPWEFEGQVALRHVVTLSLSFDHRLIDGEQGSRFLVDLGTMLSDPAMVLTMV
ncbi:2-oxo acid dehydrogenase subunit E2 [Plantibacter sp. MCCC 1A11337]|uniref:dihydrolipoamide acetyltransferase family protein n=1 Tax=Plantibacter sp. MCCC 1A11337 TaxID=2736644 RepID=UPI001581DCAF|nr:dihydrolipoamide acetyltransferase family protein [Plantibacter sp. MCCC 1A11337]NUJ89549.1 2-oxo acid dehydrogenase subunit E2 [Plantibacter sp. MCCC 1A11337]